ncbi:MAG TPA: response regulator transcription factor [Chloroflexi bacterium]|nr:response regulator transcription factor [Chloroflexota bacterium]
MSGETILLIERPGKKAVTFASSLERKGFQIQVVLTGQKALEYAAAHRPALIVLNAPSLGTSGIRICRRLHDGLRTIPIIHILPEGTDRSRYPGDLADVVLEMPFTARKLINRIKRLLPGERKDAIEVGPIRLAPGVRVVEAYGREKKLTPKAASLLQVFLTHPGETLSRGFLMQQVWQTDYVGDTRTLDVHVRWVREAIEPNPAKPCHIVTVRGVGYRFEPEACTPETPR